jgi:hypothetical protein
MCFSARLPLADRTGAIASPGPSSLLPLFTEVPRETVWKIGIASNLGSDERATACEEAPLRCLLHQISAVENPFSYFSNSL